MSTSAWDMGDSEALPLAMRSDELSDIIDAVNLEGVWAPCLTPIHADLSIDDARLFEHVDWLLSNGCSGIVLFGTTGEAASFSATERMQALETLIARGISTSRIMVGTGFTAISDTVQVTKHAVAQGCRAVLMIPPFYFKDPTDSGLISTYRHVIDETNCSDLKVLLYHFPRMSTVPISYRLIDALIESHGDVIAGLKDSTGDWNSVEGYIKRYPDLAIFPGTDALLLKGLRAGGAGTITATADINPHGIGHVFDLWRQGEQAGNAQTQVETIRSIVFEYPLAAALKAVHASYRSDSSWNRLRPPLVALNDADQAALMGSLDQVGFQLV